MLKTLRKEYNDNEKLNKKYNTVFSCFWGERLTKASKAYFNIKMTSPKNHQVIYKWCSMTILNLLQKIGIFCKTFSYSVKISHTYKDHLLL